MRSRSGNSGRPGSAGFTLVETVVALAIFAAAMTIVFSVLVLQQRSFAVQGERTEMRRNLRRGIEILEKELKNAGSGLPHRTSLRIPAGWIAGSGMLLVSGLGVADGEAGGPDALVVARALSPPVRLTLGMETGSSPLVVDAGIRWSPGMLGVISDGTDAEIFRVSRSDGGTFLEHGGAGIFGEGLSKPYGAGAMVARVLLAGYAVAVPGDHGPPDLVRREVDGDGNMRSRTIAEGISDLQIRLRMSDGSERDAGRAGSEPFALSRATGVRVRVVSRGRLSGDSPPGRMEAVVGLRNRGSAL